MHRKLKLRLSWWWNDAWLTARRAGQQYAVHQGTQIAAGISYYIFFSIFPLTIFAVTTLGQLSRHDNVKGHVVDTILSLVPLEPDEVREPLTNALDGISTNLSLLGFFSILGLVWSGAGMITAIRRGLTVAWDSPHQRPPLRGKLLDLCILLVLGVLALASIATTGLRHLALGQLGRSITAVEPLDWVLHGWLALAAVGLPVFISFAVFVTFYRWAPAASVRLEDVWQGALVAAVALELVKLVFTFYIRNVANYNALYGSLGAIVVTLLFIFLASNVLLLGAEVAAQWPQVRAGRYDDGLPARAPSGPRPAALRGRLAFLLRQSLYGPAQEHEQLVEDEQAARARLRSDTEARSRARRRAAESATQQRSADG
jgi:membrane protein